MITNPIEAARQYLDKHEVEYVFVEETSSFVISHATKDQSFEYYPLAGRWRPVNGEVLYHVADTSTLLNRYLGYAFEFAGHPNSAYVEQLLIQLQEMPDDFVFHLPDTPSIRRDAGGAWITLSVWVYNADIEKPAYASRYSNRRKPMLASASEDVD